MKNYLGNLIARHMNEAEVLQPRMASRFEPQPSVLESDGPLEVETAEGEVAESFGVDSVSVAPVADSVSVAPLSDPVFVAPVSPVNAPEIELRVESASARPSRFTKEVFDSNGPPPSDQPEVTNPTGVTSDQRDSTASKTTSVVASDQLDESFLSEETGGPETPNVTSTIVSTSSAGTASVNPDRTRTTNQVAGRLSRKSTVATQPVAPTQPVTTREPVTPRELVQPQEPVTIGEATDPLRRPAPAKFNRITTPPMPVELERSVPRLKTETGMQTVVSVADSEPSASGISHLEGHQSSRQPKPLRTNSPAEVDRSSRDPLPAVVVPEPEAESRVVIAGRESQVSPKQPQRVGKETTPPPRAHPLETSIARSPRNDPMNARTMSPDDIGSVETGPTINVTIGRIEVRATASEVRPQKQRREQQVLSLDEYLSQRSAGGR